MARPKKFNEAETLQKAMRVFWRQGYSGTSMQDLVAAMGINAPSLYSTYGGKRELFIQALKSYQQDQQKWLKALATGDQPVRSILQQLLEAMMEDSLTDSERKGCFMINTTTELANQDDEMFCIVADNERAMRSLLADLIQQGQASGELASDQEPQVLATYLFTVLQGLRVTAATNQNRALLQATVSFVLNRL